MNLFRTLSATAITFLISSSVAFADSELVMGDQGTEVAEAQGQLVQRGYDVMMDGDFGPATVEAVKSFQETNGFKADGNLDSATFKALVGRDLPENLTHGSNYISRRIVNTSMQYIGVPYVFGGNSPKTGLDCSAYVKLVYSQVGISLPRTADAQYEVGTPVSKSDLLPGDAVFFETYAPGASHVGIYIGDGNFIHASSSKGVTISSLGAAYYTAHYLGARRMVQ